MYATIINQHVQLKIKTIATVKSGVTFSLAWNSTTPHVQMFTLALFLYVPWVVQSMLNDGFRYPGTYICACYVYWEMIAFQNVTPAMAYSHCTTTGPVQDREWEKGSMGSNISWRNVHTGLRQGQGPGSIVSYCSNFVPCTGLVPGPVQCD